MNAFGIEIRKLGDTKSFYKEVDMVLQKNNMLDGAVSDKMKMQTVAHSLQKMLKADNFFSVCTIKDCAELCQLCIPAERIAVYRASHCIHWNQMLPDFREALIAMILDDFRPVLNP